MALCFRASTGSQPLGLFPVWVTKPLEVPFLLGNVTVGMTLLLHTNTHTLTNALYLLFFI